MVRSEGLDPGRIPGESRRRTLLYPLDKLGRSRVQEELGVSKVTMWRLERGVAEIDDGKLRRILSLVTPREFEGVLGFYRRLRAAGVVKDDGTVDYPIALEVPRIASSDGYLKQLVIRFVVENFREDVRRAIDVALARVELRWDEGSERFLRDDEKS